MRRSYSCLSLEQRLKISEMLAAGNPAKEIAKAIGVHFSTVYRELKRGVNPQTNAYDPHYAEAQYRALLLEKGSESFFAENTELAEKVSHLILQEHLSPEAALSKLREQGCLELPTKTTLYAAIDSGLIPNVTRDSLHSVDTTVFSGGIVHLPKWVRLKLNIYDGDTLEIQVEDGNLILCKKKG